MSDMGGLSVTSIVALAECGAAGERRTLALPADAACVERTADDVTCVTLDAALPQDNATVIMERNTLAAAASITLDLGLGEEAANNDGPLLCLHQHKEWWMRPVWAAGWDALPNRTQLVLWRDGGARWHVLIAVCDGPFRADLAAGAGPRLVISIGQSGHDKARGLALVAAEGDDPYALIQRCVAEAARRLGIRTRERRPFPKALEGFGWCTWDSLGRDVNESAIFAKMDEFAAKGVPVSWVLIDDGWSRTEREAERLVDFDADPERFPQGLGHTIDVLKTRYGVRHVGVWQAFHGYWQGLAPDGPAARSTVGLVEPLPNGCLVPGHTAAQSFGFWHAWDARLEAEGVDFAKVDSQSSTAVMTRGAEDIGLATRGRHEGLDAAVALHFDGALINCMGMAPEDYWHRPASPITRSSDDYLPHDHSWLAEHAIQNAYASLLVGGLYHCDWDMFWTEHPQGRAHAVLRWISGGPFYCSDALGRTDPSVLAPFVRSDGAVVRPDGPAVPVLDSLLEDPTQGKRPLGLMNRCGEWRIEAYVGLNPDCAQHAEVSVGERTRLVSADARPLVRYEAGDTIAVDVAYGEVMLLCMRDADTAADADPAIPFN